ncbi:MAG: carbohydrate-binding domain-containing protein [Ruminococcaceae bacterium]|nr:carbohydrate-binding domain-containing protein [Oscillospiraceae bacterium]
MKKLPTILLLSALLLQGCADFGTDYPERGENTGESYAEAAPQWAELPVIRWEESDYYSEYKDGVFIDLEALSSGSGYTAENSVITITEEGTYVLTGTLSEGRVVVDAKKSDHVRLVLDNTSIHCTDASPIEVKKAERVTVSLPEGTENNLSNGAGVDYENTDIAGILSKCSLVINGSGRLTVSASSGDGIRSKDTLRLTGGVITVSAADRGFIGKDSVEIKDVEADISSVGDGIRSNNDEDSALGYVYIEGGDIRISTEDDGISAEGRVMICGGSVEIAESLEGIEGKAVDISGGVIRVKASDDGLNATDGTGDMVGMFSQNRDDEAADVYIRITGGDVFVDALGDGVDSNGIVALDGGTLVVMGPDNGANGYMDTAGTFSINGGVYMGVGTSAMLVVPASSSSQQSFVWSANAFYDGGSIVEIRDGEGATLFSRETVRRFNSITFSSLELAAETEYFVYINDEQVAAVKAGTASGGTGSFGGFGGNRGGRGERPEMPQGGFGGTPPEMPNRGEFETREGDTMPPMPEGGFGGGMPTDGTRPEMPPYGK